MIKAIIAAMTEKNHIIGKDGKLPWHIPNDLQNFQKMTYNHNIIMGRKTFESIGKPLGHRTNIVITSQPDSYKTKFPDVHFVDSLDKALAIPSKYEYVFIIGGAEIYKQALPIADCLFITWVLNSSKFTFTGDTYFPPINWSEWEHIDTLVPKDNERNRKQPPHYFMQYNRKKTPPVSDDQNKK